MYVFPGRTLNVHVQFQIGDDPASPTLAAYIVRDMDGVIVQSTPITVAPDKTDAWITIPANVHALDAGEKYRQHRIDVSFTAENMVFDKQYAYYVVPDLFISHTADEVRKILGASQTEVPDSDIDFYRSYIDLSSGKYGDDFLAALSSDNLDLVFAAKQLIFWHSMLGLVPVLRMRQYKSVESETSKITRIATSQSLEPVEKLINDRYDQYLSMIFTSTTPIAPAFFIVTTPVDPVTGV